MESRCRTIPSKPAPGTLEGQRRDASQRFLDAAVPQHPRAGADGPDRRRGQARPRRSRDGDPGRGDAPPLDRARAAARSLRGARPVPARCRRAGHLRRALLVLAARSGRRTPCRHRWRPRPFRAGLVRPQGARPPDGRDPPRQLDRLRRVRTARRRPGQHPVPGHGVLDQRRHRGQRLRRVAPLHDPDQLEQAGRVRARSPSTACRAWSR